MWRSCAHPTAFRSNCCRKARSTPPSHGRRCPTPAAGRSVAMPGLLINIDVPDLTAGEHFYTNALGLTAARRFDDEIVELTGCEVPIYLILKQAGSATGPDRKSTRLNSSH